VEEAKPRTLSEALNHPSREEQWNAAAREEYLLVASATFIAGSCAAIYHHHQSTCPSVSPYTPRRCIALIINQPAPPHRHICHRGILHSSSINLPLRIAIYAAPIYHHQSINIPSAPRYMLRQFIIINVNQHPLRTAIHAAAVYRDRQSTCPCASPYMLPRYIAAIYHHHH
jgi:hypothetical protein